MEREIRYHYLDPIDVIWCGVANQLGMTIQRTPEAFASWDGLGTLQIGTPETLDPDDSLAQMVLHEVCHWMVEGPDSIRKEDWGLVFGEPEHEVHEHACLRLQCHFADQFQLREFFGSTTNYRVFFDSLGRDPLGPKDGSPNENEDQSIVLAREGLRNARQSDVESILLSGVEATRKIADSIAPFAGPDLLWTADRPAD